jgi:hypothetical protein
LGTYQFRTSAASWDALIKQEVSARAQTLLHALRSIAGVSRRSIVGGASVVTAERLLLRVFWLATGVAPDSSSACGEAPSADEAASLCGAAMLGEAAMLGGAPLGALDSSIIMRNLGFPNMAIIASSLGALASWD